MRKFSKISLMCLIGCILLLGTNALAEETRCTRCGNVSRLVGNVKCCETCISKCWAIVGKDQFCSNSVNSSRPYNQSHPYQKYCDEHLCSSCWSALPGMAKYNGLCNDCGSTPYKCANAGCSNKVVNEGDFCLSCKNITCPVSGCSEKTALEGLPCSTHRCGAYNTYKCTNPVLSNTYGSYCSAECMQKCAANIPGKNGETYYMVNNGLVDKSGNIVTGNINDYLDNGGTHANDTVGTTVSGSATLTGNVILGYDKLPNVSGFIRDEKIDEVEDALNQSGAMSTTYKILLKVGISLAIIIILLMGVKWIMAAPQQRAELKQSFVPLIVGVFLLFCGATIGEIVVSYMDSVFRQDSMGEVIEDVQIGVSSVIYTVGISIALIIILVNGVQWLMATPQKRAELKGRLWNVVIGVGLLIGATFILSLLGTFFENINI